MPSEESQGGFIIAPPKFPAFDPLKLRMIETRRDEKSVDLEMSFTILARGSIAWTEITEGEECVKVQDRRMREIIEQGFIECFVGYLNERGSVLRDGTRVFAIKDKFQDDIMIVSPQRLGEMLSDQNS